MNAHADGNYDTSERKGGEKYEKKIKKSIRLMMMMITTLLYLYSALLLSDPVCLLREVYRVFLLLVVKPIRYTDRYSQNTKPR